MKNTGDGFYDFLTGLQSDIQLPDKVEFINPYNSGNVNVVLKQFCDKFYSAKKKRFLILGINPGRFGGGITGIPFTDPVALSENCNIPNLFDKRFELSSRFIYEMIHHFGGTQLFYDKFLLSAVCPLGFIKEQKNYNYYDSAQLFAAVDSFIKFSLLQHTTFNVSFDVVIVLGKKNAEYLKRLNDELMLFNKIVVFDHPRYIMQYKLTEKKNFIMQFCKILKDIEL